MRHSIRRFMLFCIVLVLLLLGLMFWGIMQGNVLITYDQVLSALGFTPKPIPEMLKIIIIDLRIPRALLALLCGASLAIVGTLLQTTTKNELADPFLFGLSSGASAGAVFVITRFGNHFGEFTLPLAAFSGGILSAIVVLMLFYMSKSHRSEHLIVCGLSVSFLFSALTSYFIFSGDQRAASSVIFWSLGGLGLARWDNLLIPLMSFGLLGGFVIKRWQWLDGLLAGEQTAISLGIHVARLRIETFLCCALATSCLVSITGVIGFVGLLVPHVARFFVGVKHRLLIPLSALFGALLLCIGDIISRTVIENQELPIGVITAGIGGIFVIGLQIKRSW